MDEKRISKGAEHARLTRIAGMMGMMVSRRIQAEYKVTVDDILNYRLFDDTVAMNAYGVDIHNPDGAGCELYWLIPGHAYSIPYRSLLPLEVENIIAAGRCIAVEGIAVMATCFATGRPPGCCRPERAPGYSASEAFCQIFTADFEEIRAYTWEMRNRNFRIPATYIFRPFK